MLLALPGAALLLLLWGLLAQVETWLVPAMRPRRQQQAMQTAAAGRRSCQNCLLPAAAEPHAPCCAAAAVLRGQVCRVHNRMSISCHGWTRLSASLMRHATTVVFACSGSRPAAQAPRRGGHPSPPAHPYSLYLCLSCCTPRCPLRWRRPGARKAVAAARLPAISCVPTTSRPLWVGVCAWCRTLAPHACKCAMPAADRSPPPPCGCSLVDAHEVPEKSNVLQCYVPKQEPACGGCRHVRCVEA